MTDFATVLAQGRTSTGEALSLFDSLGPASIESMLGSWDGAEFPTGHWLDGLLEAYGWSGKRFDSPEQVHPLVFRTRAGGQVFVRPTGAPLALDLLRRFPRLRTGPAAAGARKALPLFATAQSQARLRTILFRGVATACMVYDSVPIIDVFRRVDANTVLGLMDMKGMNQAFFFVLRRARTQ